MASGIQAAWCKQLPAAKTMTNLAKPIEGKQFLNYCYKIYIADKFFKKENNRSKAILSASNNGVPF